MKIGILCPNGAYKVRFEGLTEYLQEKGHTVDKASTWLKDIHTYDVLFLWNGYTPKDRRARRHRAKVGYRLFYLESGFFPQKRYSVISNTVPMGGQFLKDIEPVTLSPEQIETQKRNYLDYAGIEYVGGDYIFAPLQLPKDKSIVYQSKFTNMQQFVNRVESLYRDQPILFKSHPRDRNRKVKLGPNSRIVRDGNLFEYIANAKLTVAINSTVLFEAAYAGCPVQALGQSPFNAHPDNPRGIVHEVLLRQTPIHPTPEQIHPVIQLLAGDYFEKAKQETTNEREQQETTNEMEHSPEVQAYLERRARRLL